MGKHWYWCSSSSSGGGGAARSSNRAKNRDTISFSGCISLVFQFFDFHHFQYCLHQPSSSIYLPDENHFSTVLKGMEAPRNSLELELESEEAKEGEVSVLSSFKQDDYKLHILMGMQIKTRASNDLSSECSCSPGTKTPTLVARLMGLDLLPDDSCSSPSSSIHATPPTTNKAHLHRLIGQKNVSGTCSLPETPRVSSSSSRRSVDEDRRLSLQINKDNISKELEFKSLIRRKERRYKDENRSARQIAKEVKESVSRRVGLADITNSSHSRRRDEELLVKSKKLPKSLENNSCSPRLTLLESSKNKSSTTSLTEPLSKATAPLQKQPANKKVKGGERFKSRLKKPPQTSGIVCKSKQQETFVRPPSPTKASSTVIPDRNKCNKTTFSRKQSHVRERDGDGAQESRRSSRLPSCASQKYMQATHTHKHKPSGDSEESTSKATCAGSAQYEYVTNILKRTGVYKDTTAAMPWFSPSQPLDPSIFHQLELTCSTVKDRKLLFHVVDEMLVETCGYGPELVDTLCAKTRSFPGKDCRGVEDIDAIIERDLSRLWFEEEEKSIVNEIDTGVLDTLLHETASMLLSFRVDDPYLPKNGDP